LVEGRLEVGRGAVEVVVERAMGEVGVGGDGGGEAWGCGCGVGHGDVGHGCIDWSEFVGGLVTFC